MAGYEFRRIEKEWQAYWAKQGVFKADNNSSKPKYYVLDMFPYPSGAGLHVGHPLGYIASDIVSRYKRHNGFNVLHPMGWDAFGLPAEQYAIQTGQHPAITTDQNIKRYREQLDAIGFSFDWSREFRTSDPEYYKWTQWIFIQLFNSWYNNNSNKAESIDTLIAEFEYNGNTKVNASCDPTPAFSESDWKAFSEKEQQQILLNYRLAFLSEAWVNWCPALGTVLANDEVKDGVSERGGYPVERKQMTQWSLRITAYAERLLQGLDTINWSESIKEAQRNWIGKSEGTSLRFSLTPNPSPVERGATAGADLRMTADKIAWPVLKEHSRDNRKADTEAENHLWQLLRNKQTGYKFRRQHVIGTYIVDFICIEKQLIIEVDGGYHLTHEQQELDENRTLFLQNTGYEVLRFSNEEVLEQGSKTIERITEVLQSRPSVMPSPSLPEKGPGDEAYIEVFTTRPDTIFGVSFLTLAPEHELVAQITTAEYKDAVDAYVTMAKNRSERERMADVKSVSGQFTGAYAEHPFTGKPIPVWIGDYVLAGYGTGAVMAVPAHDSRDFAFAKHFKLPIPQVVKAHTDHTSGNAEALAEMTESYDAKEGVLVNSDFLNGLDVKAAIKKAIAVIEERGLGKGKTNYRLRDAVFGRQRYWGEPIPVYYKDGLPYPVAEKDLPVVLPEIDKYLPTETGEPPLARANNWTYKPHPQPLSGGEGHSESYPLETTTMPGWAGSSWYFLRYMDPHNDSNFADKTALDYWQNVDLYIGGTEHATGHLLYFRFWTKFLHDLGYISVDEPAQTLVNQGMIQGVSSFASYIGGQVTSNQFIHGKALALLAIISKEVYADLENTPESELKSALKNKYNFDIGEEYTGIGIVGYRIPINHVDWTDSSIKADAVGLYVNNENTYVETGAPSVPMSIPNNLGKIIISTEVEKMSKSKYNVVNPDDVCEQYGADTLRLYEMFLGPLQDAKPWSTQGIEGVLRFLRKFWRLAHNNPEEQFVLSDEAPTKAELKILHRTIKKVTEDIENFSFNTSVSAFMVCVNELQDLKCNKRQIIEPLTVLLSPYAPHICEEMWKLCGHNESIEYATWPVFNAEYLIENEFNYPISFNGKVRFNLNFALDMDAAAVESAVLADAQTQKYLEGKAPKKIIVVKGRIVNVVV